MPLGFEGDNVVGGHVVGSHIGNSQRAVTVGVECDGRLEQDVRRPEAGQVLDVFGLDQHGSFEITFGHYGDEPLLPFSTQCRVELQVVGGCRAVGPFGHTSSLISSRRSSRWRGRPVKSLNVDAGSMPRCRYNIARTFSGR